MASFLLSCRKVRTWVIPNPAKSSYEFAKAYIPISLTYFLLKTIEKKIVVGWIKNMRSSRRAHVSLCGVTKEVQESKDVHKVIYAQSYTEDVVILIRGQHVITYLEMIQRALSFVGRWCDEEGLVVNPSKTVMIPFKEKGEAGNYTASPMWDHVQTNGAVWLIGTVTKGSCGDCRNKPVKGTAVGELGDNGRLERHTNLCHGSSVKPPTS
ncbi:hypothetical protein J6590_055680 [Homalodisca vitripennis]|nr:hypothetical protein J6590_055680 [Homalodisca vitripennis]